MTRHAAAALHAGRADRVAARRLSPRLVHHGRATTLAAATAAAPLPFSDKRIRRGARGHEHGGQRAGRHGLCAGASPQPGFEMAGKTGTAQVRAHHQGRTSAAASRKNAALPWKLRDHAPVHRLRAGRHSRAMPAPCIVEHGARRAHPAGADGARHPALRPEARSAEACPPPIRSMPRAAPRRREAGDDHAPLCRRQAHARHRRQAAGSELGPGAADHHHRLRRHRHALFGGGRAFPALGAAADRPASWSASSSWWWWRSIDVRVLDEPGLSGLWRWRCCC